MFAFAAWAGKRVSRLKRGRLAFLRRRFHYGQGLVVRGAVNTYNVPLRVIHTPYVPCVRGPAQGGALINGPVRSGDTFRIYPIDGQLCRKPVYESDGSRLPAGSGWLVK